MVIGAAVVAECKRRGYLKPQTLTVLTLAIDEHWTAIPPGFFDQLDALQHPTINHWYNLAQLRGQPAFLWQAYEARLYVHIREAEDIYDGKDVPVTVTRKSVEFAKRIFYDRLGDDYVYGGTFDSFNIKAGADCSGLVTDELGAVFFGTAMHWDREGLSTESYRDKPLGPQRIGPFDLVHVASLADIPADAAVVVNLHHEGAGGPDSHMNCIVDGIYMEESGSYGCCTAPKAIAADNAYWNDHWYVPGPIVEDGTPRTEAPGQVDNTFFADVSEFQVPVDDSYPYPVLSIRVCDGTYQDHKFAQNYAWMRRALDSGKLAFGIVYTYARPGWQANADTVRQMIDANGGLHPKVALMLDVESGGNPAGDGSAWINALHDNLAQYAGSPARIIGYANAGDFNSMWKSRPVGLRVIAAGYGSNPNLPGQVAHQYTDGTAGAGQGLPMGCPPFGNCDMNVADNLSPTEFAAACGIQPTPTKGPFMALTDDEQKELLDGVRYIKDQLGPGFDVWGPDGDLGKNSQGQRRTFRAGLAAMMRKVGA